MNDSNSDVQNCTIRKPDLPQTHKKSKITPKTPNIFSKYLIIVLNRCGRPQITPAIIIVARRRHEGAADANQMSAELRERGLEQNGGGIGR
jgi:hypothetical protein